MKNTSKSLAALLLLFGSAQADSKNPISNKTFMATRPLGTYDLARQYSGIWDEINQPKKKGMFGGFLNVTGLYNQTTKGSKVGKYFGFDGFNTFNVGSCGQPCGGIDRRNMIQSNPGESTLTSEFNWSFEKKRWGVVFDYYQDLTCLYDGLYLQFTLPVIHEKLESCINVCSETQQDICTGNGTSTPVGVVDYFSGKIVQNCGDACYPGGTAILNTQLGLCRAQVNPCCSQSKTGVGDLDLILGYDFLKGHGYNLGFNMGLVIPTGNRPHGNYVWEPVIGSGNSVGFGFGILSSFTAWEKNDQALRFHAVMKYRYHFQHDECRTLGHMTKKWGQYLLAGSIGSAGVQPAANFFTQEVDVKRRNHVATLVGASYHHGNFIVDLGYEMFARQQESVQLESCCFPCEFGFAGWDYQSCNQFTTADIAQCDTNITCTAPRAGDKGDGMVGEIIIPGDLDRAAAETPAVLTNKIYASLAYTARSWEYPVNVRFGGYYEFADRANPSSWEVYGGAGIAF